MCDRSIRPLTHLLLYYLSPASSPDMAAPLGGGHEGKQARRVFAVRMNIGPRNHLVWRKEMIDWDPSLAACTI
jgi:hypothetical protein